MTIYYLYVKTHNQTGLNYLGKTVQDPFKYKGSGVYWRNHLKKHGEDVTTEILGRFNSIEELAERGLYYSKLFDVVESDQWANFIPEAGGMCHTEETRRKISQSLIGNTRRLGMHHTEETKQKFSNNRKGDSNGMFGKSHSKETKLKLRKLKQGKKLSEEHRNKISEGSRLRWLKSLKASKG